MVKLVLKCIKKKKNVTLKKCENVFTIIPIFIEDFDSRLCHKEGHADPPPRNDPHHFLIVYDAQCSESNENMNEKNFRFLFFELSSKIGVIFSEK